MSHLTLPSKARLAPTQFHTPPGRVRPRTNVRPAWLLAATMHRAPALRCTRQVQQAETLRCFVVLCSKRCWWLGSLDVTSAFLLTPIPKGNGFPVFALMPPRLLVRTRPCQRRGAVDPHPCCLWPKGIGLRESPKLWSDFRDCQLLGLRCTVDGEELRLVRGMARPKLVESCSHL